MEDLEHFISENKAIIAAVITGLCTVLAAMLRRDPKPGAKNPVKRMFFASLISLVLGGGLLAAEWFKYPLDPDGDLNINNPGAILCLAGCMLVSAGLIWSIINGLRLVLGRKPEAPADPSIKQAVSS